MHAGKYLILSFAVFFPSLLFAQDITGLWKGTLYNDSTKKFYRYEIGISEEKGKLSGFSHTFFLEGDKEFYGVKKVKVKKMDGKIIVEDAGLIANNYPVAPAKGVRQLNVLELEIKDSIMTLTGPFSTNRTKEYSSLTGTINLQRKNDFWQSALVPHLQELHLSNDLSFVKKENDRIKEEESKIVAAKETAAARSNTALQIQTAVAKKDMASNNKKEIIVSKDINNISAKKELAANNTKEKTIALNEQEVKTVSSIPITQSQTTTAEKIPTTKKEINIADIPTVKEASISKAEPTQTKKPIKEEKNIPVNTIAIQKTEEKNQVEKIVPPAAEVAVRQTILQQTVFFNSDSLEISLYDNGEVDGDTVSVLMNGKIIMAKVGLSTKAVKKTIYAGDDASDIELVMYAENLGSIPPNTGLLVVHDGKSIYEIRFSGDLQKNASIILRKRKSQ